MTGMTPDAPLPGTSPVVGRRLVRCRMCGRPLTGREARLRRLGADCAHKAGQDATVRGPGRFVVEQEELPET